MDASVVPDFNTPAFMFGLKIEISTIIINVISLQARKGKTILTAERLQVQIKKNC
jgi:hypothetical protein